jgi:hypothetical protein
MTRLFIVFYLFAFFDAAGVFCIPVAAQSVSADNLTIEEVVKLTRAKFSEDIIITKIKKNAKPFNLTTEEMLDLAKAGVTDTVIKYLVDPTLPYAPPPPPAPLKPSAQGAPGEPAKQYPADPLASRVPPEPGLYVFRADTVSRVDLKFLLGTEEPKTLMKKGKTVAYLMGATAGTHVNAAGPEFYVRLIDGKEIEELVLVSLLDKNGRREIAFAQKQELKAEDMRQRDLLEVGPRLYRVTPAKLEPGEYLFLFIGSAEPPKGVFGKGYDFSINAAVQPKSKPPLIK